MKVRTEEGGVAEQGTEGAGSAGAGGGLGALARLTPASIAGTGMILTIAALSLQTSLDDPDFWWHLKMGEIIVDRGGIPSSDPFSFTNQGAPWLVQEWGSEVLFHGLASTFGLRSLIVWGALMLVLCYLLVARLLISEAGNQVGTWGIFLLTAFSGMEYWNVRPNLVSYVLFALTLTFVRSRGRQIWWVVPIMALWANMHGMFLLGIGLVLLVATTEGLKVALRWEGAETRYARRLWLVGAGGLLASFLNPHALGLHSYAFRLLGRVTPFVAEWLSPSFHEGPALYFFLPLVVLSAVALTLSSRRPDPTDVALVLAFLTLTLLAARNITLGAVVLGVVTARYLPEAVRSALGRRFSPRRARQVRPLAAAGLNLTALIALAAGLVPPVVLNFPASDSPAAVAGPSYPGATLESLAGTHARLFTIESWAGLALYVGWPNLLVQIDGRADFYGPRFIREYREIRGGRSDWEDWLRRYCVTHVLLRESSGLAVALSQDTDWTVARREVKARPRTVLFVPRLPFEPAPNCRK